MNDWHVRYNSYLSKLNTEGNNKIRYDQYKCENQFSNFKSLINIKLEARQEMYNLLQNNFAREKLNFHILPIQRRY
jgi:hypothetical protein